MIKYVVAYFHLEVTLFVTLDKTVVKNYEIYTHLKKSSQ